MIDDAALVNAVSALSVLVWIELLFAVLQGWGRPRGRVAAALAGGVVLVALAWAGHFTGTWGLRWVRAPIYRGDVLALSVLVPLCGTALVTLLTRQHALAAGAGVVGVFGGFLALAADRAQWHWEFVLLGTSATLLLASGLVEARAGQSDARRLLGACMALSGVFAALGTLVLAVAWVSGA